jgi:hypothetical protein
MPMRKFILLIFMPLLTACSGYNPVKFTLDSINNVNRQIDSTRGAYIANYHKVLKIDTTVVNGKDTMRVHVTYYCLFDYGVTVPKIYYDGNHPKDFVTHNYASRVLIIMKNDTVFNRVFTKQDFYNIIEYDFKKYGVLCRPYFDYYSMDKGEVSFNYSVKIPIVQAGNQVILIVNKKGTYRVRD